LADEMAPATCGPVPVGDHGGREWPRYGQVRVVESDREVFARIVGTIDPITDVGRRCEGLKSVQKPFRDIEVVKVAVVEPHSQLVTEGRRFGAYVDDDVVDGPVGAPDKFGFAGSRAAMHPANRSPYRPGLRVLDERRAESWAPDTVVEDLGVECAGEEAALVPERLGNQNHDAGELCSPDPHEAMLP